MTSSLVSPTTGLPLQADGPDGLRDAGGGRWPLIDGIPYLRTGREPLVAEVVARIDRGDRDGALIQLLADQDDWWTGAKPDEGALRHLVRERERLTLREAMELLAFDRVGHYFAYRWSDPTFVAGLGLLEAHWRTTARAFELACGIGHYGRELMRRDVAFTGGDVVFSKLWLARHWVLPGDATLLCFDAASPWPLVDDGFDLVFCNDAFYFLEPKPAILRTLRGLRAPGGRLALSHIHNSGADNLSAGRAVSPDALAALFPDATVYDDAELTRAVAEARAPRPAPISDLAHVEAFSVEDGVEGPARAVSGGVAMPPSTAGLTLNPLYCADGDDLAIAWPSSRYAAEYGGLATYPSRLPGAAAELARLPDDEAARRRILVDLPDRW